VTTFRDAQVIAGYLTPQHLIRDSDLKLMSLKRLNLQWPTQAEKTAKDNKLPHARGFKQSSRNTNLENKCTRFKRTFALNAEWRLTTLIAFP
jgi:hypothetical protein